jgi:transcription initiation protein SPT3
MTMQMKKKDKHTTISTIRLYRICRLKVADQVTRSMTQEEYIYYSECRQASFTYKKLKRFKEWCEMHKYIKTK